MSEWTKVRIGDLCKTNTKSYSPKEGWTFVNYLDTGNITKNVVDEVQYIDLSKEKLPSRAKRKVEHNSVLFSTVRPNQLHYGIIKSQPENFLVSTGFAVMDADSERLDPDYLYYLLSSNEIVEGLHAIAEQSTSAYPSIKPSDIENLEVDVPDIKTQKKISAVLVSIDEKIRSNTAINKNLEAQAQALMLDYCDKVYDTAPLGTVMSFINGFAFRSSTYLSNGEYRIITIKNVQDGRVDAQGASFIDAVPTQMKPECNLQIGDVLLSLTGNVGRVGIVCEDNLLLNQRVAKFQPFDRRNLPFLYFYYRLPETKVRLETIAKGTAQANLSPVETLKLEFPFDQSLMSELSDSLSGMFSIIENNQIQNLALAETRDTLLPRLMSGELDVFNLDL